MNTKSYKITGHHAIRIAERDGVTLHKDPQEGYCEVTISEAQEIAAEDARLIYCIVTQTGWTGDHTGMNVDDFFRGSLNGTAISGATYLGPDEDGVEPTWTDAAIASWYDGVGAANPGTNIIWHLMDTPCLGQVNEDGEIEIVPDEEDA